MSTLYDAVKKALADQRRKDVADKVKSGSASVAEPETIDVRYVRCKTCLESQSWEAFMVLHGGRPHFCKCKPGDEDLVTFTLKISKEEVVDADT